MDTSDYYDLVENEMKNPPVKSEVKSLSLDYVIEQMLLGNYDFEPPYQRGKVWSKIYSITLLKSILDGTPIGAIHLVKKCDDPTSPAVWVLDAKQRLNAIEGFVRVGSTMKLRILDDKGQIVKVSWKEIKENAKSKWRFIYDKMKTYQITVVTWDHCDFETQGAIFDRVNNSVALNSWERIYGKYFIVKALLQYIFKEYFVSDKFLNKQQAENRRNSGIQLIHSVLCISFGYDLEDQYASRTVASKYLDESCQKLEKLLRSNKIDAITEFDEKLIEKLGLTKKLKSLKLASVCFEKAMNYKNNLKKNKFESGFILDVVTFLTKKIEAQILTTSIIEQSFEKIHSFVLGWYNFKNASNTEAEKQRRQAIKSRSTQSSNISNRHSGMEEIFSEIFDNKVKNNKISNFEKNVALLTSPAVCPISGVALSDGNCQIDHIIPKSTSDQTPVAVLSDTANRRKSDQTLKTIQDTEKFILSNII